MGRVSEATIKKLNELIDSLPDEDRSKCALCNETLTHIVKQAEVETGAGTATVTRVISKKLNEAAAPHDQVTPDQLRDRVRRHEGSKEDIRAERPNKAEPEDEEISEEKGEPRGQAASLSDILPPPKDIDNVDCGESQPEKDSGLGKYIEPDSNNPWGKASFLLKLILSHLQNNCDLSDEIQDSDQTHLKLDFEALEPYRQKLWDEKYKDYQQ